MILSSKIIINQPKEKVWSYLINSEHFPLWMSGLKDYKYLEGEPGKIGYKAIHFYKENGMQINMLEEVVSSKPEEYIKTTLKSKSLDSLVQNSLVAKENDKTLLICNIKFTMKSFVFKMAIPLLKSSLQERMDRDFSTLRKLLEKA